MRAPDPSENRAAGSLRRPEWWRLNYIGLGVALLAVAIALTPSLLPRPWLFQGIVAGIAGAMGYGIGVLISWVARKPGLSEPSTGVRRTAWWVLAGGGALLFVGVIVAGALAQNSVRELVDEPAESAWHIGGIAAVTLGVGFLLILCARGIRRLTRWLTRHLAGFMPARFAGALAVVTVLLLGYWVAAGALLNTFLAGADAIYAAKNADTPEGLTQPGAPTRSGSPASLSSWESLGYEGRAFVGRGPTTEQISAFSGKPAVDPIRVFVGVETAATAQERAAIAVAELQRTGAFDRSVLVLAGATGTGWLEPQSMDAIEYMWSGDTAIASIQYSVLPSWISFLVDLDRASEAGQALFEAVYDVWSTMPADSRPKLVPYGLSMGSFAAQAPFSGVQDLIARTDGALFVGTPNFTEPWAKMTAHRDAGSDEWQPVYQQGATARWAAAQGDLAKPGGTWQDPHVVFMQHASDPVVWWSFDLMSRRPDWLKEPRGPDVSPNTRWFPMVTFLQVTVDQFFGVNVPPGHGHNYVDTIAYAWQNVVAPPGWTDQQSANLQALIDG